MKPGSGRQPRPKEAKRSTILALVKHSPLGRPTSEWMGELTTPDPPADPEGTPDLLRAAA